MAATPFTFRQLIDLAIGTPEPGHVNFYALHCLLYSFADKLNIVNDKVDCKKFQSLPMLWSSCNKTMPNEIYLYKTFEEMTKATALQRMSGGAEEAGTEEAPKEGTAIVAGNEAPAAAGTEAIATTEQEGAQPTTAEAGAEGEPAAVAAPAGEEVSPEGAATSAEGQGDNPPEEETAASPVGEATEDLQTEVAETPSIKASSSFKKDSLEAVQSSSVRERSSRGGSTLQGKSSATRGSRGSIHSFAEFTNIKSGVAVMKDQLELAMQQLALVTSLLIDRKSSPFRMEKQLRTIAEKLRSIQRDNVFIEGAHNFVTDDAPSILSYSSEHLMEEEGQEEEEQESRVSRRSSTLPDEVIDHFDLEQHLTYSPEKMLDQLLDLKSNFCALSNKVNQLSATIIEQDCQRTMKFLNEMQEQLTEFKLHTSLLREVQDRIEGKQTNSELAIGQLKETIQDLSELKIDKSEIGLLLADKADYRQLQRKVSQEQYQELQCRLEKQFCEIYKIMNMNEKSLRNAIDNMQTTLGIDNIDDVLKAFKEKIDQQIMALQESLHKYMESTNDECAAAGARIKVLQDLACLSCDTNCVMRTIEKTKLPKMPNAHATQTLGPLVTYELGSIRKSGTMGYYRKDEFPHAPNAWMSRQTSALKACVPRHAGGSHTTYTAKERIEKVNMNKK